MFDHKNRPYTVINVSHSYTYLECVKTGARLKIANNHLKSIGFTATPKES
jgi:hypothetical protein